MHAYCASFYSANSAMFSLGSKFKKRREAISNLSLRAIY